MKYQVGDTIEVVLDKHMADKLNDPDDGLITVELGGITKHTPKPFDWSEAKAGMAFIRWNNEIVWFVANDFTDKDFVVTTSDKNNMGKYSLWVTDKSNLTRAPEHDVEV